MKPLRSHGLPATPRIHVRREKAARVNALLSSLSRFANDMNDKQDRPYVCSAPGCSQVSLDTGQG